jgi:hypothetical protein
VPSLLRVLVVLCAATAPVVFTACGSSGSKSGSSAGGTGGLQACLKQQGIQLQSSASGGPPAFSAADRQKLRAALAGPCKQYAGALGGRRGRGALSPAQRKRFQAAQVKFSACMKQHGVTVAPGGPGGPGGGGLNRSDPKVAAALKACQSLRPRGFGGGRPGGGPPGQGTATQGGAQS